MATPASTRVMKTKIAILALIPAAAGVVFCSSARAKRPVPSQQAPATSSTESTQSVWDGIYTTEQANRGETLYAQRCARCHGPDLGGGEIAPALNSAEFKSNWYGLSVDDLLERIKVSMPQDDPGSLSRQQTADILAFVLSKDGFQAGKTELAREAEVLKAIRFEEKKPQAAGDVETPRSLDGAESQAGHGGRIAVANEHASSVQFFDLATGELLKDISTLKRPHEMVIDREASIAYVSIAYKDGPWDQYESPGNQIQVIDVEKMEITSTIDISPHWAPHGLALDQKTGLLYASCESNGGEVIVVDMKKRKVMGSVRIGVPHPHSIAVVPSRNKAYTANKDIQHISVVDLKEMKLLKDIPAATGTDGIIATPDGKYVFVGNFKGTQLLVVDPTTDEVIKTIPFDLPPSTFALSPGGSKLYITFHDLATRDGKQVLDQPGFVQEFDVATLTPGPKMEVGHFPLNMTVTPDAKTAVVDTTADGAIAVVDLIQMKVIRRIKTDEWPHGVVVF